MSIYIAHHRRKSSTELDSKRTVMSTRWKFIWLESSAWQEVVKDWLERFWKECHRHPQQVVKHFGHCLDMIEPNCASCLCFASCLPPTFVWWRCKAPPGRRSIEELGEHHWLVNNLQYITVHPVTTHDYQFMQGLCTPTDDLISDRQVIAECDTKHSNWRSTTNIR